MESKIDFLPFHNKDILPKYRRDKSLFLLMTIGIPFAAFWLIFVVLPSYHQHINGIVVIHFVSALFILYNIFGNMFFLKRIDASGKQKDLPIVLKPNWTYCHLCQLNSPPRSYHCPICDECILKRDHHCMFSGCCIGYHNHRYYLILVLYVWIGAVYGIIFEWEYSFHQLGGFGIKSILSLIAPHFAWVLGAVSAYGFLVATLHAMGLIVLTLTTYLLVQQSFCIFRGQTLHERKYNIYTYNLGWKRNFLNVFGSRWYLVWLSAWLKSPLTGDGLSFQRLEEIEEIKDI